jgi:hypothetical protein
MTRNVPGIAWVRRPLKRDAAASIAVRDRLLDAVVQKLLRGRETKPFARHLSRALDAIRSKEVQVRDKAYFTPALELEADAWISAITRRTGKEKMWAMLDEAAKWHLIEDILTEYGEHSPTASKEDWKDKFRECWRDVLGEQRPLTEKVLTDMLSASSPGGRALRLVYERTDPPESIEDFRKKLSRAKRKPFA